MKFTKISKKQFEEDFKTYMYAQYDDIKLPSRATEYSAGYDIYAPFDIHIEPGKTVKFPTGIRVELDTDKFLLIVPRSGLGFKYGIHLNNTVGVIDCDYINSSNEGHIWVKLHYPQELFNGVLVIPKGEAVCQGIILPYFKVENDNATEQRTGGFGSTTKNE